MDNGVTFSKQSWHYRVYLWVLNYGVKGWYRETLCHYCRVVTIHAAWALLFEAGFMGARKWVRPINVLLTMFSAILVWWNYSVNPEPNNVSNSLILGSYLLLGIIVCTKWYTEPKGIDADWGFRRTLMILSPVVGALILVLVILGKIIVWAAKRFGGFLEDNPIGQKIDYFVEGCLDKLGNGWYRFKKWLRRPIRKGWHVKNSWIVAEAVFVLLAASATNFMSLFLLTMVTGIVGVLMIIAVFFFLLLLKEGGTLTYRNVINPVYRKVVPSAAIPVRKPRGERKLFIFWKWIEAGHRKICPFITFKDDQAKA